jgi:hypothetical protein
MLGVRTYPRDYIKACRTQTETQVGAMKTLTATARGGQTASATAAMEPEFYNNLVIVLDAYFCHRLRSVEGKDGNPLNEVRLLADSLKEHQGIATADRTIRYAAEQSVLHHQIGDAIRLDEPRFTRLAGAFFAEIEGRYT